MLFIAISLVVAGIGIGLGALFTGRPALAGYFGPRELALLQPQLQQILG
jgi:hypothetical protein